MKVAVVGGGPAGLYLSVLLKKAAPAHDIVVLERNAADATYGWGVVFSDRTLGSFREADPESYEAISDDLIVWDAIDVIHRDRVVRCGGQAFSGISRRTLLGLLQDRCRELGVGLDFERDVGDVSELDAFDVVVGADGVRSVVRDAHAEVFRPRLHHGRSRYIWFGTGRTFDSFTFVFRSNAHGLFQAHAYPFDGHASTFIVECNERAWLAAGLDQASEDESIAYCEELFAPELRGHRLMSNNSKWLRFVTLRCSSWRHGNVVLVGDAAHTAHFSIGSGTKLAMEDSISLATAVRARADIGAALADYELDRKPRVERFQDAARQSQTYFENTSRYRDMAPLQFAFHLLSRSGRMDYGDLRLRDQRFVGALDRWFATRSDGRARPAGLAPPPAFSAAKLAGVALGNRMAVAPTPGHAPGPALPAGRLEIPARSGAGLVFSGIVAVSQHARITRTCPGIYRADQQNAWKAEVERARSISDAAFAITLGHAGPRGSTRERTRVTDVALRDDEGWEVLAASPLRYTARGPVPVEMDDVRQRAVLEDFVSAARRARAARFDMVELHMAHGYLLATFVSPLTNRRTDRLGGSRSDRLRYPLAVLEAVRAEWPVDKPVGVALCASDWAAGGLTSDDAVEAARAFKDHGCDVIRVLAGHTVSTFRPRYDQYFLTHYADRLRNEAGVATIATGDITTVDHVNTIVAGGRADVCLLRAVPG